MTQDKIVKEAQRANVKFEVAKQIRSILDEARKQYGPTPWDEDDQEGEIQRLVFEE